MSLWRGSRTTPEELRVSRQGRRAAHYARGDKPRTERYGGQIERPLFYYDLFSPYAYMAAERIGSMLPEADWRPIFLWGLFKLNGRSTWVLTDEREPRMAEIDKRAAAYGLPPIRWPTGVLASVLDLARAGTVAKREGYEVPFSLAAFRAVYAEGRDPSEPDELRRIAAEVGLDDAQLLADLGDPNVKDALRRTTEEAHARGVPGVPTVVVGDAVYWGDDRLEEAAQAAERA